MVVFMLILLGLCFGSFVNALVWRMHEQAKPAKRRRSVDLSITRGRSVCVHCGHILAAKDLIPVLSWLGLWGKCRYCKKPISWQYPFVELVTAYLFLVSYLVWPYDLTGWGILHFACWLAGLVLLVALAVYDLKWMELPDRLVGLLTVVMICMVVTTVLETGNWGLLMGAVWGVVCIAGVFYVLFQVSGGKWIGGGDVKLGIPLGIMVGGPLAAILLIFVASVLGTLVVGPFLLAGKRSVSQKLPFGPFLVVAGVLVYLWGGAAIDWYQQLLLLST